MDNNQLIFSGLAIILILGIVINASIFWAHKNVLVTEMVLSGISPIAANCAMEDPYGRNPTCIVLAAQGE